MTRLLASRRDAEDLQALLDGDRPSSATAGDRLQPLASLATALAPSQVAPSTEFVAGLRERLVIEAAARVAAPVLPTQRRRHPRPHQVRRGVAAVAALALLGGAGAAVASTRAVPGDDLYGLKRGIEHVQLSLARGDVGRGSELLEQGDARLGEAEALAAGEHSTDATTRARIATALAELAAADSQAVTDLTRAYGNTGDPSALALLDQHLSAQRDRLGDLMALLGPGLRAQARDLEDQLSRVDAQMQVLLGTSPASAVGTAAAPVRSDPADVALLDGAARRVAGARLTGSGAGSSAGGIAGSGPAGAVGVQTSVAGLLGAPGAGSGSTSAAGRGPLAAVTGAVGALTGVPAAASPTPAATSSPTSSALVTNPVGTVTSAVPLPSAVPSASLCVPVPPLTAC